MRTTGNIVAVKIRKSVVLGSMSLTPLIDIVFLLVIFFLVTSQYAEEDRELSVVLPTASEAQPLVSRPAQVIVSIDANGTYYVDGQLLGSDDLQRLLEQVVANHPLPPSVNIRADHRTECQALVRVMNLCNQVGILDYSVATSGGGRQH